MIEEKKCIRVIIFIERRERLDKKDERKNKEMKKGETK